MAGVPFDLNVIYNVDDVARILDMHPQTIRQLCRSKRILAVSGRSGYRITGWSIRNYAENRCVLKEQYPQN